MELSPGDRLRADGGGVEQDIRALERHGPRHLREPLVPADADTDAADRRIPDPQAQIAGGEIELLLIALAVGNVGLAIEAEDAVGVDNRDAVEELTLGPLEKADGHDHAQLAGQRRKVLDDRVTLERPGQVEVLGVLLRAEIGGKEQLLQQHQSGALPFGFPDHRFGPLDVVVLVPAARHLGHGDGQLAHGSGPSLLKIRLSAV